LVGQVKEDQMQDGVTMLVSPLPGVRLIEESDGEDGSILAFRKGGDEVLFTSWDTETPKGMTWIPVREFSPDPEAVRPPDIFPAETEEQPTEEETTETEGDTTREKTSQSGPFGKGGLRRRPQVE
jgi:hypothetical protein